MKIRPLNDWVLLEQLDAEEKTAGGIIIPDLAKERPHTGIVIAVGPGTFKVEKGREKEKKKIFIPTELKPGNKVIYEKYMVSDFEVDGHKIVMVREENVLGIFEAEKPARAAAPKESSKASDQKTKKPAKLQKPAEKKKAAPKTKKKK